MTAPILLEIALATVEDALAAQRGGADRIELNAALALGGLTPSLGTFLEIKRAVSLPILPIIRPRSGGFCYSEADYRVVRRDIDLFLAHGVDGLVFGLLTEDGGVDVSRCRELMRQVGNKPVVFHRAFDVTPDPFVALEQLIDLGVRRILTSGQETSAYNGSATIAELIRRAAGRIEILPAAGIQRFNVADVIARTGCTQVHASLRSRRRDSSTTARPHISFGALSTYGEDHYDATDAEAVRQMREILTSFAANAANRQI